MDIFKSLRPLALALSPRYADTLSKLREQRQNLVLQVTEVVNSLGPELYPDFKDINKLANLSHEDDDDEFEHKSHHTRSKRSESVSSSGSHALSRVTSESSLANMPLFGNADDETSSSTGVSRINSGAHSRSESRDGAKSYGHTSATERGAFESEVSQRIRDAMEERARQRGTDYED